jgi:excisionase family DNA binding protein
MVADLSTLLTVAQASRRSEYLSEPAIRARIIKGEIPVIRLGGSVFIERDALDSWLKRRGVKG